MDPTYNQVTAGGTGHREAVQVFYDPKKVTYAMLLQIFWRSVDPTDDGGQFCDRGESYKTGIFATSPEQKRLADASKHELQLANVLAQPIVTPIEVAGSFYPAEDYHQDYYKIESTTLQILPLFMPPRRAGQGTLGRGSVSRDREALGVPYVRG